MRVGFTKIEKRVTRDLNLNVTMAVIYKIFSAIIFVWGIVNLVMGKADTALVLFLTSSVWLAIAKIHNLHQSVEDQAKKSFYGSY